MVKEPLTRGAAAASFLAKAGTPPVEWQVSAGLTPYAAAVEAMEARAAAIAAGGQPELVWLVEHPALFTAGASAVDGDLLDQRFPVFKTGRGGQYTYHGPGQRVAYVMLDLQRRQQDLRAFVAALEDWLIATLAAFSITGERRESRVGVWVKRPDKGPGHEDKIAAIGIRVRRWVTYHGISLNVAPELGHFSGIVPCGVTDQRYGVTSLVDLGLADLGLAAAMPEADAQLRAEFERRFGQTAPG